MDSEQCMSINLWFDSWIDHDPIASWFPLFHFLEKDFAANIVDDNQWHIPGHLPTELYVFLANYISSISLGEIAV